MAGNAILRKFHTIPPAGPVGQLQILTSSLPNATVGSAYSTPITIIGGTPPYSCTLDSCFPNDALWLKCVGASLVGTPQMTETETLVFRVTDSATLPASVTATFSLVVGVTGSLSIVSAANAGATPAGGAFAFQNLAAGGVPPYVWSCGNQAQPWVVTWNGWLLGAPSVTGGVSFAHTVTDSAGATASQTVSVTVNTALTLGGIDSTTGLISLPQATAGQPYQAQVYAAGGTGSGFVFTAVGLPAWASLAPSGVITGTPVTAGNITATVNVKDGGNNQASATAFIPIGISAQVARPAYNSVTSNGFFILNGQLYDPAGFPFRIRGLNRTHFDSNTWTNGNCGARAGANAVRVFMFDGASASTAVTQCQQQYLSTLQGGSSGNFILPILTLSGVSGTGTTGSNSIPLLASAASDWLSFFSTLSQLGGNYIVNPMNEWGAGASSSWQAAYQYVSAAISNISGTTITVAVGGSSNPFGSSPIALISNAGGITTQVVQLSSPGGVSGAWTVQSSVSLPGYTSGGTLFGGMVGVLRGARYTQPIMIDSGGSGQDMTDLLNFAAAIQQSDPLQNCFFGLHPYGSASNAQAAISAITRANPAVVTLNSSLPYHPFDPSFPLQSGNNFTGQATYLISGVNGMTQINGIASTTHNNTGGSSGAWTITLSGVNSSAFNAYTSGGTIVCADTTANVAHYNYIASQMAALRASNVCVGFFEFGPGNPWGANTTYWTGSIAATTMNVTAVQSGKLLTQAIGSLGYAGGTINGAGVAANTVINSGPAGGTGNYTVSVSQAVGSEQLWINGGTGPSPTSTSIQQIICAAEAYQLPWCYWAFDDHNLGPNQGTSWIGWFGMTNLNTAFSVPSDLTAAGMEVTFSPRYGLKALAAPAAVSLVAEVPSTQTIKWTPGLWMLSSGYLSNSTATSSEITDLAAASSQWVGYCVFMTWSHIEDTTQGVYNWTDLDNLINACAAMSPQRHVMLQILLGPQFHAPEVPTGSGGEGVPQYILKGNQFGAALMGNSGFTANAGAPYGYYVGFSLEFWANFSNANVAARIQALANAMGARYNANPLFDGIILTAWDAMTPAANIPVFTDAGYFGTQVTPAVQGRELLLSYFKAAMPNCNVVEQTGFTIAAPGGTDTVPQKHAAWCVQNAIMLGSSDTIGLTAFSANYTNISHGTTGNGTWAAPPSGTSATFAGGQTWNHKSGTALMQFGGTNQIVTAQFVFGRGDVTFAPAVTGSPTTTGTLIAWAPFQLDDGMQTWMGIVMPGSGYTLPALSLMSLGSAFSMAQSEDFAVGQGNSAYPTVLTPSDILNAMNSKYQNAYCFFTHLTAAQTSTTAALWPNVVNTLAAIGVTNTTYPTIYNPIVTTLTLTSSTTTTSAWTFAQAFKQGDVPSGHFLSAINVQSFQADVRNLWPDGSVKLAVLSGISNFTANTPLTMQLQSTLTPSGGTSVSEPSAAAVANVKLTFATTGTPLSIAAGSTVALSACLLNNGGTDLRTTWNQNSAGLLRQILGPVMSEFHYYQPVTPLIHVLWYVRAYSNGAIEIDRVIENGWWPIPAGGNTQQDYSVSSYSASGTADYSAVIGMPYPPVFQQGPPQPVTFTTGVAVNEMIVESGFAGVHDAASLANNCSFYVNGTSTTIYIATSVAQSAPAWSNATAYVVGNFVALSGNVYQCNANNTGNAPPNASFWTPVSTPSNYIWVKTNGASALPASVNSMFLVGHAAFARWSRIDWIGSGQPITPQHNVTYLRSTKLVPNYGFRNPTAAAFTGQASNQSTPLFTSWQNPPPFTLGLYRPVMSNAGYGAEISILPQWEALYCTTGDPRAYYSTVVNHQNSGRWQIYLRDSTTGRPVDYRTYPNVSNNTNPAWPTFNPQANVVGNQTGLWDIAHHPSNGYLPYLLEGRYRSVESLACAAAAEIMTDLQSQRNPSDGSGLTGVLNCISNAGLSTRGLAWAWRTMGQIATIMPRYFMGAANPYTNDTTLTASHVQSVSNTYNWHNQVIIKGNFSANYPGWKNTVGVLGCFDTYSLSNAVWGAHWMVCFQTMAVHHIWQMQPEGVNNWATDILACLQFSSQNSILIMGSGASPAWNFRSGGLFMRPYAAGASQSFVNPTFLTIPQGYSAYITGLGLSNSVTANPGDALFEISSQTPIPTSGPSGFTTSSNTGSGYWANQLWGLIAGVDSGATGAVAAYALATGASNYAPDIDAGTQATCSADNAPQWAVLPAGL